MAKKHNLPSSSDEDVFIVNLFTKMGGSGEEATTFNRIMRNTASANTVARLESKLDVQNSKIDAQNSKYNTLIVILSILAATGILGFLANIFNWGI